MEQSKIKVLRKSYTPQTHYHMGGPEFKRAIANPKKVYSNVWYEKTWPTQPRTNSNIVKYVPEKGPPSKVKLSIFG